MKKRLLACALAATMILGSTAPVLAADDGSTQGTNTFVDGGTDLSFWTFQELHVGFWTSMADEWNKQNPDRPINLTVTTGESSSLHSKLLIACQSGEGAPDMADIEIGHYGAFLKDATEPVVRVMVEASDLPTCEKYVDQVIKVMEEQGHCL